MLFGKSQLEKVLDRWTKVGGRLDELLESNIHQPLKSASEAKAICAALDALRTRQNEEEASRSPLFTLAAFFQNVESESAFGILAADGLPRLRLWVRDLINGQEVDHDAALFVVKILAIYQQRDDIGTIANVARMPATQDAWLWSMILGQFTVDHPLAGYMVDALRDPLPNGFVLVSYLDMANALAIGGRLKRHPFDSKAGVSHLQRWLQDDVEDSYSYALSATAALPFITDTDIKPLLETAYSHPDPFVRIEAAWADAKRGGAGGVKRLSGLALDPRFSQTACRYLQELGHERHVPAEAKEPEFQAVAEMASWLTHPSEFGRPPDEIDLFDSRELFWPPTNDRRRLFLVKYSFKNPSGEPDVGIGMVGSVTFALFGEATEDLSPEDIYGLHCCWELEMNGDPRAPIERTVENGRAILSRYS